MCPCYLGAGEAGEEEAEEDKEKEPDGHADDDLDDAHLGLGHLLFIVSRGAVLDTGDDDADGAGDADAKGEDGVDDV